MLRVALRPPGLVTTTLTAPAACAAVVPRICVELSQVTLVAARPPRDSEAPERKLLPVTVTTVPPAAAPEAGLIEDTAGAGIGVEVGVAVGVGVGVEVFVGVCVAVGVRVDVGVGVKVEVGVEVFVGVGVGVGVAAR